MKTKTCSKCKRELSTKCFYKHTQTKDKLYTHCIGCRKAYLATYYQLNKKKRQKQTKRNRLVSKRLRQLFVLKYLKEHPCVDCGESNPIVLEFDHAQGKKFLSISDMIQNCYSEENISKEIEKCEVRCSNCHKKKTAVQYNWYDYIDFSSMTIKRFRAKSKSRKRHLQIS